MTNKNPQKIKKMFNEIASFYDEMNDLISFKTHYLIKKSAIKLLNIKSNSKIIDICTGTGDLIKIMSEQNPSCQIIGLDNSDEMIKLAKIKNPENTFILSDILNNTFKNEEFDYITISFGLRNIENRSLAIKEMYRILKKDGKLLHLDFGKYNFMSALFDIFTNILILFLGKNKKHYKYLIKSKNEYPKPNELIEEFKTAGFENFRTKYYLMSSICAIIAHK